MTARRRGGWRSALMLLASLAGGVGSPAAAAGPLGQANVPVKGQSAAWTADPDSQFMLDVRIRATQLGEGVRAHQTPEGACVLLGDLIGALSLPVTIDGATGVASGWAFYEKNRVRIDLVGGRAVYGQTGVAEPIPVGAARQTPDGWCVDTVALARWLGIGVRPVLGASMLLLSSETKLPVELAEERRKRAMRIRPASFEVRNLPQVRLPYRMWRAPALDFVVDAGVTYDARSGVRVDRRAAVLAAGEIAHLSYEARIGTARNGLPSNVRLRAYRADPDGGLLGPARATQVAVGDVDSLPSAIVRSVSSGRGAMITNRPLVQPLAFDRTTLTGELPPGWEAELYRNGELLAFAPPSSDGRYRFDEVALLFGDNRLEVITYGPQGQMRSRVETLSVAGDSVPAGKTQYWAGVVQPGRELIDLRGRADRGLPTVSGGEGRGIKGTLAVAHGLSKRMSVAALVQTMSVDDQRVTFVEGSVRRTIGPALVELAAARDSQGGRAYRGSALAKVGSVNISAQSLVLRDFRASAQALVGDHRLAIDSPLRIGHTTVPLHGDVRLSQSASGAREYQARARSSFIFSRFNLATDVGYRRRTPARGIGGKPTEAFELGVIGSGRIGRVRLRGGTRWEVLPEKRLQSVELSSYWSASEFADWEVGAAYGADDKRVRARIAHVRRFQTMAVAASVEGATDGSVAVGLALNFSLDSGRGGFRLSRQQLASTGSVRARVYRDLDGDGVRDSGEPDEPGALITAGMRLADRATDAHGLAAVGGLENYRPVAIGLDLSSLKDPTLVPVKAAQVIVPRPGVAAEVEIGLSGGGDVEGVLLKAGGGGWEGLDVELIDARGATVATERSDYDGYFLFDRVGYGTYSVRLSAGSAKVAGVGAAIGRPFRVTADSASVRLGSLVLGQGPPKVAVN
jgi:hypothetical protein